jgi:arylsulfatase A-like enzyme
LVLALVLVSVLTAAATQPTRSSEAPLRPNILLVLTDDQRFDELDHMATLQTELLDKGIRFDDGIVSDPLCCPSRASILTGTYSHTNGVYTNVNQTGGFKHFSDATTIATTLHGAGYHTGIIGKYLNGYTDRYAGYLAPGWDRWLVLTKLLYVKFSLSDQGVPVQYTSPGDYLTDVLGQAAVDFVRSSPPQQPIFLYWAPYAPHGNARPATKYKQSLKELPPLRPPSYNEADVSDKPAYVRDIAPWTQAQMDDGDAFRRRQYQTLLSVDDWLGSILTALAQTGRLSNTLIVFMSDNGHPIGEHRLGASGSAQDKASPYEESIKVPFIVRWDAAGWTVPRTDDHLVANVDLAETFANAAGTTEPGNEGLSLLPLLDDPGGTWRPDLLIEHGVDERYIPAYCGVRTANLTYVQYSTGEEELYDLVNDPFELQNEAENPAFADALSALRARDHQLCVPTPPGFAWHH